MSITQAFTLYASDRLVSAVRGACAATGLAIIERAQARQCRANHPCPASTQTIRKNPLAAYFPTFNRDERALP